jgi:hypothetical protein
MQATNYSSYKAYTTAKTQQGLQVIPEDLFNALVVQDKLHKQFKADMQEFVTLDENKEKDGSINWSFVDADMYPKWSVLLEGKEYTALFDEIADIIEPNMEFAV